MDGVEGVAAGVATGMSTTSLGVPTVGCNRGSGDDGIEPRQPQSQFNRSMVSMLRCAALRVDPFLPEAKEITYPSIES